MKTLGNKLYKGNKEQYYCSLFPYFIPLFFLFVLLTSSSFAQENNRGIMGGVESKGILTYPKYSWNWAYIQELEYNQTIGRHSFHLGIIYPLYGANFNYRFFPNRTKTKFDPFYQYNLLYFFNSKNTDAFVIHGFGFGFNSYLNENWYITQSFAIGHIFWLDDGLKSVMGNLTVGIGYNGLFSKTKNTENKNSTDSSTEKNEISFDVMRVFNNNANVIPHLMYRRISGNGAFRLLIGGSFSKTNSYYNPDMSSLTFLNRMGGEITNRFQQTILFYGVDAYFQFNKKRYYNNNDDYTKHNEYGFIPFIGLRYALNKKFSAEIEVGNKIYYAETINSSLSSNPYIPSIRKSYTTQLSELTYALRIGYKF